MAYVKNVINGAWVSVTNTDTGDSILVPSPTVSESVLMEHEAYRRYKAAVEANPAILIDAPARPLRYTDYFPLDPVKIVTTTAAVTEFARYTLSVRTMCVAKLEVEIINMTDAGVPVRHIQGTIVSKRINAGALLVGSVDIDVDIADTAGAIPLSAIAAGNDIVFRVQGVASTTLHWHLSGEVKLIQNDGRQQ